jgi:hypothetical protein
MAMINMKPSISYVNAKPINITYRKSVIVKFKKKTEARGTKIKKRSQSQSKLYVRVSTIIIIIIIIIITGSAAHCWALAAY